MAGSSTSHDGQRSESKDNLGVSPDACYLEPQMQLLNVNGPTKDVFDEVPSIICDQSSSFLSLFGQDFVPSNTFTHTFLQSILSSVESKDPVVANAWVETLLDVIDLLPKEVIRKDILTLAINKGQLSQSVSSRLLCCKMLGKISMKFDPYVIKKEILPLVQSLCQDVDHNVRACMCKQLDAVAKGIGLETTKSAILPELVELANDEECSVRLVAIETVVKLLPLLDDETSVTIVIPLVKKIAENSLRTEDSTLPEVAKQLGKLCYGLSDNFTPEQRHWFLGFYRDLARLHVYRNNQNVPKIESVNMSPMPDVVPVIENHDKFTECRKACAFNFPAMVIFADTDNFRKELYETFRDLCTDPELVVRSTAAYGFHEVVKLLGTSSPLVLEQLIFLLRDPSLDVLRGLVSHLSCTIEIITLSLKMWNENMNVQLEDLITALIICEESVSQSSNWRLHADLLNCMACLPKCLTPPLQSNFVIILLEKLHKVRAIPCRMAAARSLLLFLRSSISQDERTDIINRLIKEFCQGRSCHSRMMYINICDLVIELFSKKFFKEHFFKPLLLLADDRIPNIRLRLCRILPSLKGLLMLPKDDSLLQELEATVRKLMSEEKDRDVVVAIRNAIEELDKIEVALEPGPVRTSCAEPEIDFVDLMKEEEERKWTDRELEKKEPETKSNTGSLTRSGKIPVRKSLGMPQKQTKSNFKEVATKPPIMRDNKKNNEDVKKLHRHSIGSVELSKDQEKIFRHSSSASERVKSSIPSSKTMPTPKQFSRSFQKSRSSSPNTSGKLSRPSSSRPASFHQASLGSSQSASKLLPSSSSLRHHQSSSSLPTGTNHPKNHYPSEVVASKEESAKCCPPSNVQSLSKIPTPKTSRRRPLSECLN